MKDCRAMVGMRRGGRRIKAGKAERNGSGQQIVVAPETVNSGVKTRVDAVPYASRTRYAKLTRENAHYVTGVNKPRGLSVS
nr:unnamed protein product [Callosobruchus chinensis]